MVEHANLHRYLFNSYALVIVVEVTFAQLTQLEGSGVVAGNPREDINRDF